MRSTFRLLASVKPARYLEAGNPTGLTGLYTHSSPRSSLLYLYSSTLDKLKAVPESSLYRQSVEAVTKHRMAVVEAAEPPGYKEWVVKAQQILKEHPEEFRVSNPSAVDGASIRRIEGLNGSYVFRHEPPEKDERYEEWDGEVDEGPELEGLRTAEERKDQEKLFTRRPLSASRHVEWEPEPQLTADQYVWSDIRPT